MGTALLMIVWPQKATPQRAHNHQRSSTAALSSIPQARHLKTQSPIRRGSIDSAIEYRSFAEALHLPFHASHVVAERQARVGVALDCEGSRVCLLDGNECTIVGILQADIGN
jgi:hypothetical protein